MAKRALNKDIRQEIKKSFGRFVSIFMIVLLGVAFFSGLRSTETDMRLTADSFSDNLKLMDLRVISTMGLTEDDLEVLGKTEGVSYAEPSYMKDVLMNIDDTDYVVQLYSEPEKLNLIQVTEGRLPEADNECLMDNRILKGTDLSIGDKVTFTSGTEDDIRDSLKETEYTITGFGDSPMYISIERGSSVIGSGQVGSFAIVKPEVFDQDYYTQIFLYSDEASKEVVFTPGYDNAVDALTDRVEALEKERYQARYDSIAGEIQDKLDDAQEEYDTESAKAEKELADSRKELDDGWAALEDGKKTLEQSKADYDAGTEALAQQQAQFDAGSALMTEEQKTAAQQQLVQAQAGLDAAAEQIAAAESEIEANEKDLNQGEKDYEEGKKEADEKLADARQKIADGRSELDELDFPEWIVSDRNNLSGYSDYGDNSERMGAIGKVFPAIFFLVAALVALTAITRMVEEQRTLIGTYKALGYGTADIMKKYVLYALAATLGGSIAGVLIGEKLFPFVIIVSYQIMYIPMKLAVIPYNIPYAVYSSAIAVLSVLAAAYAACARELAAVPAQLMRPVAPKPGKRVFLERIGFIWKHMSFSQKNTFRNLFRYKKRLIMTVFGIGCCTGLMVVGFGLKDSIMNIASLQYENIQLYDAMVSLDTDTSDMQRENIQKVLLSEPEIRAAAEVMMKSMDASSGETTRTAYTVAVREASDLDDMLVLKNKKDGVFQLKDDGAVLTEQLADALGVEKGDTFMLQSGDNRPVSVKVAEITENYLMHYIYMTEAYYEECFSQKPDYNMYWADLTEEGLKSEEELGSRLMDEDGVLTVSYVSSTREMIDGMLQSLYIIVIVLVISASLLAFVVIYNLNNINMSERRRELATIKLLGFYDIEVALYVYRENVYLTLLGAFAGIGIGKLLHGFVMSTIQVNQVMFGKNVSVQSYIYSAALAVIFSVFVNLVMYFQLKKIDMIESLKSVE